MIRNTKYYLLFAASFLFVSCLDRENTKPCIDRTLKKPLNSVATEDMAEIYPYPDTKEGYDLAGLTIINPLPATPENIKKGRELFLAHCSHCHGQSGLSDAVMIEKKKYPPPPKFSKRLPTLKDGHIFHSITYGKNLMPGNLKELNAGQKWLLVLYLRNLGASPVSVKAK